MKENTDIYTAFGITTRRGAGKGAPDYEVMITRVKRDKTSENNSAVIHLSRGVMSKTRWITGDKVSVEVIDENHVAVRRVGIGYGAKTFTLSSCKKNGKGVCGPSKIRLSSATDGLLKYLRVYADHRRICEDVSYAEDGIIITL